MLLSDTVLNYYYFICDNLLITLNDDNAVISNVVTEDV